MFFVILNFEFFTAQLRQTTDPENHIRIFFSENLLAFSEMIVDFLGV